MVATRATQPPSATIRLRPLLLICLLAVLLLAFLRAGQLRLREAPHVALPLLALHRQHVRRRVQRRGKHPVLLSPFHAIALPCLLCRANGFWPLHLLMCVCLVCARRKCLRTTPACYWCTGSFTCPAHRVLAQHPCVKLTPFDGVCACVRLRSKFPFLKEDDQFLRRNFIRIVGRYSMHYDRDVSACVWWLGADAACCFLAAGLALCHQGSVLRSPRRASGPPLFAMFIGLAPVATGSGGARPRLHHAQAVRAQRPPLLFARTLAPRTAHAGPSVCACVASMRLQGCVWSLAVADVLPPLLRVLVLALEPLVACLASCVRRFLNVCASICACAALSELCSARPCALLTLRVRAAPCPLRCSHRKSLTTARRSRIRPICEETFGANCPAKRDSGMVRLRGPYAIGLISCVSARPTFVGLCAVPIGRECVQACLMRPS